MDDPCKECQKVDLRNVFLAQHGAAMIDSLRIDSPLSAPKARRSRTADHELVHALIESSDDCISVWDRNLVCLYANRSSLRQVGAEADKVIGHHIRDGLGYIPEFMKLWMSRMEAVFQTGRPMHVADAMPIQGRQVYSEATLSPVRRPDGTLFAVSIVYRDVTERKLMEQKLIDDEQKYRQLYHQAQIPLYRTRLSDGKLLECNDAMAQLLGYANRQECLEQHYSAAHYVDPSQRAELLKRLKNEGELSGFEIEFTRKDGSHGWVQVTARLDAENGCIEGVQLDITAQKVLSPAEKAVLGIILQGKSNKQIAKLLDRSVRTVEDHRSHIMRKLGVENLVDLVQRAGALNHTKDE